MASPTPIDPRDQALLSLLPRNGRGHFKVYLGSAAGVGKTVRMLQEAHDLRQRGVDVVMGKHMDGQRRRHWCSTSTSCRVPA